MILRKLSYVVSVMFEYILISSCQEKSSLTFVIDKTSSMKEDIHQVVEAATDIMNIVQKKNTSQIENIVLVTFDDPGFNLVVKTNDLSELQRNMNAITLTTEGNFDCPEMSLSGTRIGLQEGLPGSYVYVFTDDDPKDYQLVDDVINLAQRKQNQVVFVITPNHNCEVSGGKSFKEYYKIAAASYGQVFRLTEKNDVKSVLKYVEETISGQRSLVTSKLLLPNELADIHFVIDDKTEYGIVSTTGEGVTLTVEKGPTDFEKVTWLGNVKVIKLKASGDYTVRVKGSGTTSVMVFGRTDFNFKHGFSILKPSSLDLTTAQPISGQKSYLGIKVIDKEGDVDITTARILDMDENPLMEKPLKLVNKADKFYVTEPFEPPTSIFLLEIIGQSVKTNKLIIRRNQTPIVPQKPMGIPKPGQPTTSVKVEEGKPATIQCNQPHSTSDEIRWYKENRYITTGELILKKAKTSDAGVYTCQINFFNNTVNGNLEVIVGYVPNFLEPQDSELIEFEEGSPTPLDCYAEGRPTPTIQWWYNSEILDYTKDTNFVNDTSKQGEYVCVVSNDFGNITRRFVTETFKECELKLKADFSELHPILLTTQLEWPTFKNFGGYVQIPPGEEVLLHCPSGFKDSNTTERTVTCYKETQFKLDGSVVNFADLTCRESSQPTVKRTGKSCLSMQTEIIQLGYELRGKFLKVYELCFNKYKKITVYAKHNIDQLLADFTPNNTEWFNSELLPMDFESLYNCNLQVKNIDSVIFQEFRKRDSCCFSKRQLINSRDVFPGLPQYSTYSNLNVMSHWSTCNEENWNAVESRIRTLATFYDVGLEVSTGTSQDLRLSDANGSSKKVYISKKTRGQRQTVPLYVWKVVRDSENQKSLAIIQVNVPDLNISNAIQYVICEDICNQTIWMESKTWRDTKLGYTYCCNLQEFSKAFNIRSLFNAENDEVLDISPDIITGPRYSPTDD